MRATPLPCEYKVFQGVDCIKRGMDCLEETARAVYEWNRNNTHLVVNMSQDDETAHASSVQCYLCSEKFSANRPKVIEHDHLTGRYRGAACQKCNTKMRLRRRYLPVFFHNFRNYDSHILCQAALGKLKGWNLSVIPTTTEKYMAVSARFCVGSFKKRNTATNRLEQHKITMRIEFKDSYQFMASSLDSLVRNLSAVQLQSAKKFLPLVLL